MRFVIALQALLVPAPSSTPLPRMSPSSALQFRCLYPFTLGKCCCRSMWSSEVWCFLWEILRTSLASILVTQASSQDLLAEVLSCISCFSGYLLKPGELFQPRKLSFATISFGCPLPALFSGSSICSGMVLGELPPLQGQ